MEVTVSSGQVSGKINANPSKSAMQRAVAAALLATGKSIIKKPGISNDCKAALDVAQKLGANITHTADGIEIDSQGIQPITDTLNCGEAGLGIRMFTPIAALSEQPLTIKAEGSLKQRPVDFFETVLPQLHVNCQTNAGCPPLDIHGPLQPEDISVDGSLSSQFLTGLLMAFGAAKTDKTIQVSNLTSKPYIELTLAIMRHFGVIVEHENLEKFHFNASQSYQPSTYTVEGDWSGAAFLLVAAAIGGDLEVSNLNLQTTQSDIAILEAIALAGAKVTRAANAVSINHAPLKGFEFDATQCPDLFPPLVALAAHCQGTTTIKGATRLTHKESNRSVALQEEFGKMGIRIEVDGDIMRIHGGTITSAAVHSHHDHRIAMACAVAAIKGEADITIAVADAVNKSYPEFWEHWTQIGGALKVTQQQF